LTSLRSDKNIWRSVKEGDATAFKKIFEQYWEEMFSIAWRRLGDEDQAKDIVQEIFIHCWNNRHKIEVEEQLAPYLFTALKYSIVRHIYRAARKGTVDLSLSVLQIPDEETHYQDDWRSYEHVHGIIREEINGMPARMQEIFRLSKEQELSVKEISIRLAVSEQTVKNQLHTAMKRVRARLRDHALFLPFLF
jgi:RNA polymerase sigma-70 factor (family 1)